MHTPDLSAPPDLERLAAFLDSERAPAEALSLSELDGLLTAVAIGPELILPSEWLELVWGGDAPVFDSQEEASAVLTAMMARQNEIIASLECDPACYEPFFWFDDEERPIIDEWCYGFMAGVALRAEQWGRFINSRQGIFILPIMAHVPQLLDEPVDIPDLEDFDPELAIPAIVEKMHAYWRRRRSKGRAGVVHVSETTVRVKVGRNEPCPCGSGAKFKRCCGSPDADPSQQH